jgi:hypothetical protein
MEASLKILGDWRREVGVSLHDALIVSMEIMGRTGEEACKHAIILMAQSARAITISAKKNRKVERDMRLHGAEYVDVFGKSGQPTRVHKFRFSAHVPTRDRLPGTWENARKIGNAGLAKRSWMWGLGKLKPGMHTGKAIPGASAVYSITGKGGWSGYIKENRLRYIAKAMPSGWEATVEQRATNKIMGQARKSIERKWAAGIRRSERRMASGVRQLFLGLMA